MAVQEKPPKQKKRRGSLAEPLTKYERWLTGKMYKDNIKLVKHFGAKYCKQYKAMGVSPMEIYSCIDIAFIKTVRTWNPEKAKFSTYFDYYIRGEISHYLRSNNHWGFSAPRRVRELGMEARKLMTHRNVPYRLLPRLLNTTEVEIREALIATMIIISDGSEIIERTAEEIEDEQ